MKQRQKFYYIKVAKPLEAILPGETVRMKLPERDTWSPGTCTSTELADRSYLVKVGDTEYRRNRRHIQKSNELLAPKLLDDVTEPRQRQRTLSRILSPMNVTPNPESNDKAPRRSSRCRWTSSWHQDYTQWCELIRLTVESLLQKKLLNLVYLFLLLR